MAKRTDIKKILVIGSGPIIIGQAAEFDYAGTQACLSLKEEGYKVVLVNSNPATIMTDANIADKVYMEPLTIEYLARIIRKERPDAILPTLGGQTGLNLSMQLAKKGILEECGVEILGTDFNTIEEAEDRELFRDLCIRVGEPVLESHIANTVEEALKFANQIGYQVVLRPAFTLGGTGGGFADNDEELVEIAKNALKLSPTSQVLIEKSIKGFKEIEYEVMRDANDTAIVICNMENIDPVGVHTGDSMVVCPSQTLTNKEYQMLRNSSLKLIRELRIEGGCNVQFALDPHSFDYFLIEVNPRVSRSSALASKASSYPIAKVSAKVAVGMHLDEIDIDGVPASFEPALDYIVSKIARFPFDKFTSASRKLSTQMKATGEVMSIARTFENSILKAVRSLETGVDHIYLEGLDKLSVDELLELVDTATDLRLFEIAELMRKGVTAQRIQSVTKIDMFFLEKLEHIVAMEDVLEKNVNDKETLLKAKKMGFSDSFIAKLWKTDHLKVLEFRKENKVMPSYKQIDMCASEFERDIPYYYSTYDDVDENVRSENKRILVLGSGPIRIGQGVEFDYSTVHAIWAIKELGYDAIVINNNPETVSTDNTISDKLYFEPLTTEDVANIIEFEKPDGVIVSLGGQTAINLAEDLDKLGAPIIGTTNQAIINAENRDVFEKICKKIGVPQPVGEAVTKVEDGIKVANEVGYPVLVRPSYVLGGKGMEVCNNDTELKRYVTKAAKLNAKHPVLVDKYISGKEIEVDAICDGNKIFIPGIMEHIEKTGVHSGDSMSVYPTFSISDKVKETIIEYTRKLGLGLELVGLYNIQFIVDEKEDVYVIEVNPRSSRTVPFISKTTGYPLAKIATHVMLGKTLAECGITEEVGTDKDMFFVKSPTFSFSKMSGLDAVLSPEMKSTGEAIGYDKDLNRAIYKSMQASGLKMQNFGTVLVSIADKAKEEVLPIVKQFYEMGFNLMATSGTAKFLKKNDVKVTELNKISDGSEDILEHLRKGHITYVLNVASIDETKQSDGLQIRNTAVMNNVAVLTSTDTMRTLVKVLSAMTMEVNTIG